jgi:hypothetical protein
VAAAGVAQVDQRVAEAALAACPQLDFGTRHGIDRLCCRAAGYKRNGRLARAVAMTGCPETYFATDVTDTIGASDYIRLIEAVSEAYCGRIMWP